MAKLKEHVDFSSLRKTRQPTRKEAARYRRWVKYLKDSKLTDDQIHRDAATYAMRGQEPRE